MQSSDWRPKRPQKCPLNILAFLFLESLRLGGYIKTFVIRSLGEIGNIFLFN